MSNFFFAKLNDDGSYGEPIKAESIDIDITTQAAGDPIPMPSFITEGVELSFELDYKQTKDFVWNVMLNLKRSTKRLVSKNLVKGGVS